MNKFDKIIGYGCSHVYGCGLANKDTESWVNRIALHYGVDCINYGINSVSNDYISRKVIETDLNEMTNALVLILWTYSDRREMYYDGEFLRLGHWVISDGGYSAMHKILAEQHYKYFDGYEACMFNLCRNIHHTQLYLNSINVKYYMGMVNVHDFPPSTELKKLVNYDKIDETVIFKNSYLGYINAYPFSCDAGHANKYGHEKYANDFISWIENK